MEHLLDESGHQKLVDLLPDDPALLLVESTQVLSHRLGVGSDVQGVLDDFPWYARHVQGTPHKYLGVCTEKVDEHCFLFGLELGADPQHLLAGAIGIEGDSLCGFGRLKVADMLLGIGNLSGVVLQVDDERLRVDDRLGIFHALNVALVGMSVWANSDDACWPPTSLASSTCSLGRP
jgi:hypothetical protein